MSLKENFQLLESLCKSFIEYAKEPAFKDALKEIKVSYDSMPLGMYSISLGKVWMHLGFGDSVSVPTSFLHNEMEFELFIAQYQDYLDALKAAEMEIVSKYRAAKIEELESQLALHTSIAA